MFFDVFIIKKHFISLKLYDKKVCKLFIQYFKNKIEKAVDYYINSLKIYKYNEYTLRKLYNIFKKENEIAISPCWLSASSKISRGDLSAYSAASASTRSIVGITVMNVPGDRLGHNCKSL